MAACADLCPSAGLDGGRAFFNAVKEGDTVIFASDDEQDRILWVQAMYRATGQSHKPVPPTQIQKLNAKGGTAPQLDAPISQFCKYAHAHVVPAINAARKTSLRSALFFCRSSILWLLTPWLFLRQLVHVLLWYTLTIGWPPMAMLRRMGQLCCYRLP